MLHNVAQSRSICFAGCTQSPSSREQRMWSCATHLLWICPEIEYTWQANPIWICHSVLIAIPSAQSGRPWQAGHPLFPTCHFRRGDCCNTKFQVGSRHPLLAGRTSECEDSFGAPKEAESGTPEIRRHEGKQLGIGGRERNRSQTRHCRNKSLI